MNHRRLEPGLWSILATPFTSTGDLDIDSLTREARAFDEAGARGQVALGVFGEAASLTSAELAEVARAVTAAIDAPVIVGLPGRDTSSVLHQASTVQHAAQRDIRALMIQIHSTDPDEVVTHLRAVHDRTGVGIVLQDYPAVSDVHVDAATITSVVTECADVIVAVKAESTPTSAVIAELVASVDVPVFGGLGGVGLLDELGAGAAGAMTGFSHPEALLATLEAAERDGLSGAHEVWAPWLPLANFEGQPRIGLAIRKEILHRRGLLTDAQVRPPAAPFPTRLRDQLTHHLTHVPHIQEA